mmetsp:Transcript_1184/g.2473  ORF Transcript_1184/g.2473 Transcript_1184/m.2473 type:complete len:130 (-) Transcript_1184:455-844(-)
MDVSFILGRAWEMFSPRLCQRTLGEVVRQQLGIMRKDRVLVSFVRSLAACLDLIRILVCLPEGRPFALSQLTVCGCFSRRGSGRRPETLQDQNRVILKRKMDLGIAWLTVMMNERTRIRCQRGVCKRAG